MQGALIGAGRELERLVPAWDALAVAAGRPYAAPAWQLAWWRVAAPAHARPVVLVARDGEALEGVLALYAQGGRGGLRRLRLMGAPMAQGTGPAVHPGHEREVARAFAQVLADELRPRAATLELEGVLDGARWAALLRATWPGRGTPIVLVDRRVPAPVATLDGGTLDGWLAGRSANFRGQLRRARRRLEARGATFRRVTDGPELLQALPLLLDLHRQRWSARGGSQAVGPTTAAMLDEAARALGGTGRMTVELVELDGRAVSAHLFLTAGSETTYWLGGFDASAADAKPGLVAVLQGVEGALARGCTRFDLGPGDAPYKRRFADGERELDWVRLLPPGPRRPLTRLQLAPRRAGRMVRDHVRERRAR